MAAENDRIFLADSVADIGAELRRVMTAIREAESGATLARAVDELRDVADLAGQALQCAGRWYATHADEIFDERRTAVQPADDRARDAAVALRALGDAIRSAAAARGDAESAALLTLDSLELRGWHIFGSDELDDLNEFFAVTVVNPAAASDHEIAWTDREDVANWLARRAAYDGVVGRSYQVVHVLEGERLPVPLASWPGEARVAD